MTPEGRGHSRGADTQAIFSSDEEKVAWLMLPLTTAGDTGTGVRALSLTVTQAKGALCHMSYASKVPKYHVAPGTQSAGHGPCSCGMLVLSGELDADKRTEKTVAQMATSPGLVPPFRKNPGLVKAALQDGLSH